MCSKIVLVVIVLLLATLFAGCQNTVTPPQPSTKPGVEGWNPNDRGPSPARTLAAAVEYDLRQKLSVVNSGAGAPDKQNIWVALIQDVQPYQQVLEMAVQPAEYTTVVDEFGNRYAEFDLAGMAAGTTIEISIVYRVRVHEVGYALAPCVGPTDGIAPAQFTQAEMHVESSNPQIKQLAQDLAAGRPSACAKVRAFYDYAGDNLVYTFNGRDWGAQAALGEMGADCTEYASLVAALSRAQGIPAMYIEGLVFLPDNHGQTELARTEHAWIETYLPGIGWAPLDPTLGRSSVYRDEYFAHFPPNHIIVSQGRHPSTLRGGHYWTHLYWPGKSTTIRVEDLGWEIEVVG